MQPHSYKVVASPHSETWDDIDCLNSFLKRNTKKVTDSKKIEFVLPATYRLGDLRASSNNGERCTLYVYLRSRPYCIEELQEVARRSIELHGNIGEIACPSLNQRLNPVYKDLYEAVLKIERPIWLKRLVRPGTAFEDMQELFSHEDNKNT